MTLWPAWQTDQDRSRRDLRVFVLSPREAVEVPDDLLYDDVIVAEYLTFMAVMGQADIHLFVQ